MYMHVYIHAQYMKIFQKTTCSYCICSCIICIQYVLYRLVVVAYESYVHEYTHFTWMSSLINMHVDGLTVCHQHTVCVQIYL